MAFEDSVDWSLEPDLNSLSQAWELLDSDPQRARGILLELIDDGSPMGALYLADAYLSGRFGHSNPAVAEGYYSIAAERGVVLAQFQLGKLYLRAQRYNEAKECLGAAAARDFLPAMFELAQVYRTGIGGEKNLAWAERLLRRAADKGSSAAALLLGRVLLERRRSLAEVAEGARLLLHNLRLLATQSGTERGRLQMLETSGRGWNEQNLQARRVRTAPYLALSFFGIALAIDLAAATFIHIGVVQATAWQRSVLLVLGLMILALNALGFECLRILWEKSEQWIFVIILFALIPIYSTTDIFIRYAFGGSVLDLFR